MAIVDIVAKLAKLQIEQNYLIRKLSNKTKFVEDKTPAPVPVNSKILVGYHVILLTGSILCNKGDKGRSPTVLANLDKIEWEEIHRNMRNVHRPLLKCPPRVIISSVRR